MEHADAGGFAGVCVAYCAGLVFAAVVDEEQLEVGERLREDAVDAARQVLLHVINGNYD